MADFKGFLFKVPNLSLCLSAADQAEAELKDFSPYYRRQFSVAHFSQVEDDLEQHKEKITQLLKQRVRSESAAAHFTL